jgi:hypothetical protein
MAGIAVALPSAPCTKIPTKPTSDGGLRIAKPVVRGGRTADLPLSALRIIVWEQPTRSIRLLSGPRCTLMDGDVPGCMRLEMRLRRGRDWPFGALRRRCLGSSKRISGPSTRPAARFGHRSAPYRRRLPGRPCIVRAIAGIGLRWQRHHAEWWRSSGPTRADPPSYTAAGHARRPRGQRSVATSERGFCRPAGCPSRGRGVVAASESGACND